MKPATRSVHRSCARRCISGGIVPVLAIRENGKFVDYFLLQAGDPNFHQTILPYVGLPVDISGQVTAYDDWKVLNIEETSITTLEVKTDPTITWCLKTEVINTGE